MKNPIKEKGDSRLFFVFTLISGIVNTLVTALLIFDMYSFFPREGSGIVQVIFTGIAMFLLFTFTMMQFYVPFMIITITADIILTMMQV